VKVERRTQLSVYLENRVGALADLCKVIEDRAINLLGVCAIDTIEEAVLRIVPADETSAKATLTDLGFHVIETQILVLELPNVPGATGKMATALADAGINIDYIYASAHPSEPKTILILRTQKTDDAERGLSKDG